jgi:hypothetical protein
VKTPPSPSFGAITRKEHIFKSKQLGIAVPDDKHERYNISDAIACYLAEIKISRSGAPLSAYTLALRNFTESCSKTYLEEIDRLPLTYVRYMRETLELV